MRPILVFPSFVIACLHLEEEVVQRRHKQKEKKICSAANAKPELYVNRPARGRRRCSQILSVPRTTPFIVHVFLCLLLLLSLSSMAEANAHYSLHRTSEFAQLARRGEILVDRRPEPPAGVELLYARQNGGSLFDTITTTSAVPSHSSKTPSKTTSSVDIQFTITPAANSTSQGSAPSTTSIGASPSNSPLPRPFDTTLGSNFTTPTCPAFFKQFLGNTSFTDCLPLSLLLQNSNSFFQASHSLTSITQTLDATCQVNFPVCSSLMSTLANELRDDANCGQDYYLENPLVRQAWNGFVAYAPLYEAGCLKDSLGTFCYANAITNTTSPEDSYVYFLALGIPLPAGSWPTCSTCLQKTMAYFATAAANLTQPVSQTYVSAAQQIDQGCGPNFVNSNITPIQGSASSAISMIMDTVSTSRAMLLTAAVAVFLAI